MKIIKAIAYTLFMFAEFLVVPIFVDWYKSVTGMDGDSIAIFYFASGLFAVFQLVLCGLFWNGALTNRTIKEILK